MPARKPTIEDIRHWALALPEAQEAPHFDHASFRVRGKIFATLPPGGDRLHAFVSETDREAALALWSPAAQPLHWGSKVLGVQVDLARADAAAVRQLLEAAWRHKAPRRLAALQPPPGA